ncbi:RNA polymerase sigma factor [Nocardia sp. NPDC059240]|uniref:RNA polymerase sigma factor n=1 Tax=Nocardia sp. NPDC059240 TaxID=3346786 RepID=UPI0036A244E6
MHVPDSEHDFFAAVFDAHYRRVVAFARRRVEPAVADDIAAETFLRVWRKLDEVPRDDFPVGALPWIYGVARHVLLESARGDRRRGALADRVGTVDPPRVVHNPATEDAIVVGKALRELPELDQEILRLHAWEDLDAAAIAAVLGCAVTTARVRLHRARKRLAERLKETS